MKSQQSIFLTHMERNHSLNDFINQRQFRKCLHSQTVRNQFTSELPEEQDEFMDAETQSGSSEDMPLSELLRGRGRSRTPSRGRDMSVGSERSVEPQIHTARPPAEDDLDDRSEMQGNNTIAELDEAAKITVSLTLDNLFVAKFKKYKQLFLVLSYDSKDYYVDKDGNYNIYYAVDESLKKKTPLRDYECNLKMSAAAKKKVMKVLVKHLQNLYKQNGHHFTTEIKTFVEDRIHQ